MSEETNNEVRSPEARIREFLKDWDNANIREKNAKADKEDAAAGLKNHIRRRPELFEKIHADMHSEFPLAKPREPSEATNTEGKRKPGRPAKVTEEVAPVTPATATPAVQPQAAKNNGAKTAQPQK